MRVERKKKQDPATRENFAARQNARPQSESSPGASPRGASQYEGEERRAQPRPEEQRPVYYISVVAEMVETHPQTLRMYERMGLVNPRRTRNNIRLYSQSDVEQVRRIQHLTQELGVNLAGVEVIFDLLREMQRLRAEMDEQQGGRSTSSRSTPGENNDV